MNSGTSTRDEVQDAIARAQAMGDIRIAGQNAAGEDLMALTAKGVLRATCLTFQDALDQADRLRRNFTYEEQRELLRHVRQLYSALASSEEAEA
jgi:hypothetical protein